MHKLFRKSILAVALFIPMAAFAIIPNSTKEFHSGVYFGGQAGFIYQMDWSSITQNNATISSKNTMYAFDLNPYIGYSHVFTEGNLPYLGFEFGYHYRTDKNRISGNVAGTQRIYFHHALSLDLLPGLFLDDDVKTTLIYGRLGVQGAWYELRNVGANRDSFEVQAHVGGGIEHQLVKNVYMRLDYTFSMPLSRISYTVNNARYQVDPNLNHTLSIGISYRF